MYKTTVRVRHNFKRICLLKINQHISCLNSSNNQVIKIFSKNKSNRSCLKPAKNLLTREIFRIKCLMWKKKILILLLNWYNLIFLINSLFILITWQYLDIRNKDYLFLPYIFLLLNRRWWKLTQTLYIQLILHIEYRGGWPLH